MRVKFWGTRGSISKPGAITLKYGGNTSCIEVTSDRGITLVIDCGTGGHGLGIHLLSQKERKKEGHLLFSHTHWDHIQGLPFFTPLFLPDWHWDIYGPRGLSQSIYESLSGQMLHQYFPVTIKDFGAAIQYHDLTEGSFSIGDFTIITHYLNHTNLTLGYRIESGGSSLVYSCDHEPFSKALAYGEGTISGQDGEHMQFLKGADLVIHDAQYFADEYEKKVGWGHSTAEYVLKICAEAGVRCVALSHHDPLRSDDDLDRLSERVNKQLRERGSSLQAIVAKEGSEIELKNRGYQEERGGEGLAPVVGQSARQPVTSSALVEYRIFLLIEDEKMRSLLLEAIEAEGLTARSFEGKEKLKARLQKEKPSLLLIEHSPPEKGAIELVKELQELAFADGEAIPIVLVAESDAAIEREAEGVTDWLTAPFTISYARVKIASWTLRMACKWKKAAIPKNEKERLSCLHSLKLLDTEEEDEYDAFAKVAAALLDAPVALITLVDKDRQWFKAHIGTEMRESSRELSFCAHALNLKEPLIVPDSFLDSRFANNPVVTGIPHIRFYAGFPLTLKNGSTLGTLCVVDIKPRHIPKEKLDLVADLTTLLIRKIMKRG